MKAEEQTNVLCHNVIASYYLGGSLLNCNKSIGIFYQRYIIKQIKMLRKLYADMQRGHENVLK